jgi:signal transduction histidine kinase
LIHPQTAFLVVGVLYVLLPLTTWTVLFRRHDRQAVALWCIGSLLYGVGFLFIGMREFVPVWLSLTLGNPICFAGYVFRGAALQRELDREMHVASAAWLWLGCTAAFTAAHVFRSIDAPRLFVSVAAHVAGALWLASLSWQLYRLHGYRSAAALAIAFGAFSASALVRDVAILANWENVRAFATSWDWMLGFVASLFAVLYGNLAYIGIALESSQRRELAKAAELVREHERHLHSEQRVREQGELLAERSAMLAARDELLSTLAHEVRQPLNNAAAALQSASSVIVAQGDSQHDTLHRLQRASSVLTQVASALDNTLSEAVLLHGQQPIARHEVDVDTIIELTIQDIDPMLRWRIQRTRSAATRTAVMHPGLLRLALRNLIANALTYTPGDANVVINIADCDEPLALLIEVIDQGDGIPAELLPRLFKRGGRGAVNSNPFGHGLGLHIVKRVMDLHGGQIGMRQQDGGLTMTLMLPQGQLS